MFEYMHILLFGIQVHIGHITEYTSHSYAFSICNKKLMNEHFLYK